MNTFSIELPALYGDHHVTEVRKLLLELPGVDDVYASSSFQIVEVSYDPAKVSAEVITQKLDEAGYLGELPIPAESGQAEYGRGNGQTYFRHTSVYENMHQTVSFAQSVSYSGRPLWPCPGMGPIRSMQLEEE